jgi:hypothetical protein
MRLYFCFFLILHHHHHDIIVGMIAQLNGCCLNETYCLVFCLALFAHAYLLIGPRHSSSGYSLASHRGGPGSNPVIFMWDLWWTKWLWGRFYPSTSVFPANLHSTNFSTITITYHPGLVQQASSGRSTQNLTALIKKNIYNWSFGY